MKVFGERLKELRKSKGLSMEKLAEELNIGHSSISRWESDKAEIYGYQLVLIAKYFEVSTDYLLGLTDYE